MKITQNTLKEFRTDFKKTVKDLESQYGIKISLGNITFDSDGFRTKLSAGAVNTKKIEAVKKGKIEKLVGESIVLRGTKFKVIEYKSNRPKYNYVIQNLRGTRYKVTREQVVSNLV